MTRNPSNYRSPLILVAFLIGALMLLSARGQQVRLEQAKPVGRLTAQQVLNLSEPICQAMTAQPGPLNLAAEARDCQYNCWDVACSDEAGHPLLDLTWNTDTGELTEVGVNSPIRTGSLLSSERAILLGRRWLRALPISPVAGQWRLLHPPVCTAKHLWSLVYAAKGRRAFMKLEAHTGALVWVSFAVDL